MCKGYISRGWDGLLLLISKSYCIIEQDKLKTFVCILIFFSFLLFLYRQPLSLIWPPQQFQILTANQAFFFHTHLHLHPSPVIPHQMSDIVSLILWTRMKAKGFNGNICRCWVINQNESVNINDGSCKILYILMQYARQRLSSRATQKLTIN